jgi:hypothetical protein
VKGAGPKFGLGKLKIAYLSLILAALVSCGGYGWHLYMLFRDTQLNLPQPQIEKLSRDLHLFHTRKGRFPQTFNEINELLWHDRTKPDYGARGRQARVKNYYYLYTRVNDRQCAVWALPLGPRRHYASSFFFVLSLNWLRVWKGRAMNDEEIMRVPAIPSLKTLGELGMLESPPQTVLHQSSFQP